MKWLYETVAKYRKIWQSSYADPLWDIYSNRKATITGIRYFPSLMELENNFQYSKGCDDFPPLLSVISSWESFVMRSLCPGLLMGHDTFSRMCLVNLCCDHVWIIGWKSVKCLNDLAKIAVSEKSIKFAGSGEMGSRGPWVSWAIGGGAG